MLTVVRRLLSYEFTIAELIGLAIMASVPYLVIGSVWAFTHTERFADQHGIGLVVSFLASIASWPVLLIPIACAT
jgi:hypothetical protein